MFDLVPNILVMNDSFWLPYALESIRGFPRYVLYDIGSKDGTGNIIDWFVETEKAQFYVRHLPPIEPTIQGVFRNSMIAESQSEWYIIVDGDEVYKPQNWDLIKDYCISERKHNEDKIYGIFKRREIGPDLEHCYSELRQHHRVYHRTAIWKGNHPGEEPVLNQRPFREFDLPVTCYHFHNALRSKLEGDVPLRSKRKSKGTYQPGELVPFNLLEELPILRTPINNFPVHPKLEKLQHECNH